MRYAYVVGEECCPYYNLAFEHLLATELTGDICVLFLWQNDHTIVLGRNQDAYRECLVDQFLAEGGVLARRLSGGGAVYHDLGNLNFSLIGRRQLLESRPFYELIREALKENGLDAEYNGRNDLMVGGRKVSGSAAYTKGDIQCRHGTLLVHTDVGQMTKYLTPDREKLLRNSVGSVAARVANLTEFSAEITVSRLCDTLIGITDARPMDTAEKERLERGARILASKYSACAWVYGGRIS